jgi:hypothetical protein
MKTVFKVGMSVYDQVNFPDKEGKITKIENNGLITVSFSEYGEAEYVSGGYYYEDQFPTLSTKPYKVELQGFEQKASIKRDSSRFKSCLAFKDNKI